MFKLILISGAVVLLAGCSGLYGGTRSGSGAMGAGPTGASSSNTIFPVGGPTGSSGGGPN